MDGCSAFRAVLSGLNKQTNKNLRCGNRKGLLRLVLCLRSSAKQCIVQGATYVSGMNHASQDGYKHGKGTSNGAQHSKVKLFQVTADMSATTNSVLAVTPYLLPL